MSNKTASRLRQQINRLVTRQEALVEQLLKARRLIKGSVIDMTRSCGKPGCKCERGELHTSKCLSFSHKGKTRIVYLKPGQEISVSFLVRRYQRFRQARAELVKVQKSLIEKINQLEATITEGIDVEQGERSKEAKKGIEAKGKEFQMHG